MTSFPKEQIQHLINQLVDSGTLGRSPIYAKLLNYLAEQSVDGKICSEFSIAVDVFDKDSDYDITADSTVRVYIFNLRKKLNNYYDEVGKNEAQQLYIPKGEYRLLVRETNANNIDSTFEQLTPSDDNIKSDNIVSNHINDRNNNLKYGLFTLAAVIITALVTSWLISPTAQEITFSDQQEYFWGGILADNKPVMVVVGDYFIFAESGEFANEIRLVREFDVNSVEDLERKNQRLQNLPTSETTERYDLGLTYLPRGSAYALVRVQQLLQKADKTPRVIMMSELSAEDLRANHIIYIGYFSGLGVLEGYVFAESRFEVGDSYDDLIDTETMTHYRSDFIDAEEDRNFTDFGTISSFSLAENNQIISIAGTRDAGLMEMSDLAIAANLLERMQLTGKSGSAYEALFEVDGFNLTNISSKLLINSYRDLD